MDIITEGNIYLFSGIPRESDRLCPPDTLPPKPQPSLNPSTLPNTATPSYKTTATLSYETTATSKCP